MSLRPRDLVYVAGGLSLQQFGTPVWRMDRRHDVAATFTRSGSVGWRRGRDGVLRNTSSDRLRAEWIGGELYMLVEPKAMANLAYHTQAFSFTGANQWSRTGIASVTADDATAPDGTATADKLVEDTSSAEHEVRNSFTISTSNDDVITFSIWVKADERDEVRLQVNGRDGTTRTVWFDLDAGTVGTTSNATGRIEQDEADATWFRCTIEATVGSGGTSPSVRLRMGSGGEDDLYTGDGSSGLYVWQADIGVNAGAESSIVPATTALVTRQAETLYSTLQLSGSLSFYLKFLEAGSIDLNLSTLLHYGDGTDTASQIAIFNNSGAYAFYRETSAGETEARITTAPTIGQTVEFVGTIGTDGALDAEQSINGGSSATSDNATTYANPDSYAGTQLHIGSRGAGRQCPRLLLASCMIARDVRDLADFRGLFS